MPEFMTIKQVQTRFQVSRQTVWRWIAMGQASGGKAGLWPVLKLGAAVRISRTAVDRLEKRSELMKV